ncbi:Hsp20/alpha crystallin family protein [Candidatus Pacearchaeota archaeon]|nr:Hsp20/alpha crystallin family protein [Candidatus Pacearchaeota archaeon]
MWEDTFMDEIRRIRRAINRTFRVQEFPKRDFDSELLNYRRASADFHETEKEYTISLEIPGVNKEEINVQLVDGNKLLIKAEKNQEVKKTNEESYGYIRKYVGFYRKCNLPQDADVENINAEYKNGVLKIVIPKNKDLSRKFIKVK